MTGRSWVCVAVAVAAVAGSIGWYASQRQQAGQSQPEAIPLRRSLVLLPATIGPYQLSKREPRLDRVMEESLGTTEYLSWQFKHTGWPTDGPGSTLRVHLAYYTGPAARPAHVPHTLMLPANRTLYDQTVRLDVGTASLPARVIVTELATLKQTISVAVCYIANGRYYASLDDLRAAFNANSEPWFYYCKVEVMPVGVEDATDA